MCNITLNTLRNNVLRRHAVVLALLSVLVIPAIVALPAEASALGVAPMSPPASTQTVLQGVLLIARGAEEEEEETDPDGFTDPSELAEDQGEDEEEEETDPDGLAASAQDSVTSRLLAIVRLLLG